MLSVPQKATINKNIPKKIFYEELKANTKIKDLMTEEIEKITLMYLISPYTMNIDADNELNEIQVYVINLKKDNLSEIVLKEIDKNIPNPTLFILKHSNRYKYKLSYKIKNKNDENSSVVLQYFESDWYIDNTDIGLNIINGNSVRIIYQNIIKELTQIKQRENEEFDDYINRVNQISKVKKAIEQLTKKIKAEKQINKQVELNKEKRELNIQLKQIS